MAKITKEKVATLTKTIGDQYRIELDAMAKTKDRPFGFTKKTIEDLVSGHTDGMRNMILALRAQGIVEVED